MNHPAILAALGAHLAPPARAVAAASSSGSAEESWSPAQASAIHGATAALRRWGNAWDLCSKDPTTSAAMQAEQMHFPHTRLAQARDGGGQTFATTETPELFRDTFRAPPAAENFSHTVQTNVRVLQASETKVHLAFGSSRRHADGSEYTYFEATWAFVLQQHQEDPQGEPRWAVIFRSSFGGDPSGPQVGEGDGPMRPSLAYPPEVKVAVDGALAAFDGWMTGWNSVTEEGSNPVEGQIANMQWPHVRLNPDSNPARDGQEGFMTWQAQDFRDTWRAPRPEENFGSTVGENVRVVQAGVDKVHLAIRQSRRHPDGEEYNAFETLWLFTKAVHEEDQGGEPRWGIAFRSSFLSRATALAGGAKKTA